MKILHVIYHLNVADGGPPRGLAALARTQAEAGHDVVVMPSQLTSGPQTLQPGREGMLTVLHAPTAAKLLWYNRSMTRALKEAARDRDIVHIHGTWRYYLLAAAKAAGQYGIPYVIRPAGNLGRIPRGQKKLRKWTYFTLFEKGAFTHAAAIQCCSEKELEEVMDLSLPPRTFIVPQPIRSELRTMRPDLEGLRARCPNLRDDQKVMLYLGRISAIKRLPELIEAFCRLAGEFPDWHLIVAGPKEDTSLGDGLERRVKAAGLAKRVSFPGLVHGELKAACFARAEIFAQPSRHENFGMSVAEALLFGLPCVVSDGVALGREIEACGAGVVVDGREDGLRAALSEMMSNDGARRQYSLAATSLAARFEPRRVAEALTREYRRCVEEKH